MGKHDLTLQFFSKSLIPSYIRFESVLSVSVQHHHHINMIIRNTQNAQSQNIYQQNMENTNIANSFVLKPSQTRIQQSAAPHIASNSQYMTDALSMSPPLISLQQNRMQAARTNNHNQSQINVPNAPQQNLLLLKNMVNANKNNSEILLQNALSAISNFYNAQINNLQNDLSQHRQSMSLSIASIEAKQKILSEQKKKLKIKLSKYTKKANDKLNEFESHRNYLDAVNHKYHNSIMCNFGGLTIPNNATMNALICRNCGYLSADYSDLNDHLVVHKNDIPKLTPSDWKETLFELMQIYEPQLQSIDLTNLQKQSNQSVYNQNITNHNQLIKTLMIPNFNNHNIKTSQIEDINPLMNTLFASSKSEDIICTNSSYPNALSIESVLKFKENDCIDYRDFNGRYLAAKIIAICREHGKEIKYGIHYIHWDNKWNVWSVPRFQYLRFNNFGVISQRALHRKEMEYVALQKPFGDIIEVRPLHLHYHNLYKLKHESNEENVNKEYVDVYSKWHIAEICLKDKFSAQVQAILLVQNEENGEWFKPSPKADLYWVHLDNEKECVPTNTHIKNPIIVRQVREKKKRKLDDNQNINSSEPNAKKQRQI